MKNLRSPIAYTFILASLLACTPAKSQSSSAFTYQGVLTVSNAPASGLFDLGFRLFGQPTGGSAIGSVAAAPATPVSNGVFTVILDFGSEALAQGGQWLEMDVARTGSGQPAQTLAPRQFLSASPYSHRAALAASFSGPVADAQLSPNIARLDGSQTFSGNVQFANATGTFSGNGAGLTNLPAAATGGGVSWITGQMMSLPNNGTAYGPISGISTVLNPEHTAQTLSPNATVTLRNLSVRVDLPPSPGCSYVFTVRVNGTDTALTCTVPAGAKVANSGAAYATIPPGSLVSLSVTAVGTSSATMAYFGLTSE
jgi:hypothetical protein